MKRSYTGSSGCERGGFKIGYLIRTILILLLLTGSVSAEDKVGNISLPVTVKANVDRDSVTIGSMVKYIIEAKANKGYEVKFPEFGENLAEFTIKDFGSSKSGLFSEKTYLQWYILDTFETGSFEIPIAIIQFRKKGEDEWKGVATNKINIEVTSLLDEDLEKADIRDIKGPVSFNSRPYFYGILALLLIILIALVIFIVIKRRRQHEEPSIPPLPAHQVAYEALSDLKKKNYFKVGKVREYYFELSDILRHYMENRFNLRAPEMTTDEFMTTLKSSESLSSAQKGLVRDFLSHCDMVKFAKYLPPDTEAETSYESAKRLVDETRKYPTEAKE